MLRDESKNTVNGDSTGGCNLMCIYHIFSSERAERKGEGILCMKIVMMAAIWYKTYR